MLVVTGLWVVDILGRAMIRRFEKSGQEAWRPLRSSSTARGNVASQTAPSARAIIRTQPERLAVLPFKRAPRLHRELEIQESRERVPLGWPYPEGPAAPFEKLGHTTSPAEGVC